MATVSLVSVAGALMVRSTADDAALTLPAASVAVAVMVCMPADKAPVVYVHAPLLLVVVAPRLVVPSYTVMMLPASAVPLKTTVSRLTVSLEITGAAGAVVSICGAVWVKPESDRLAALPALSSIVTPVGRLRAVAARLETELSVDATV